MSSAGLLRRVFHRRRTRLGNGPVLVLGGAGYVGSMLCRRLLERNAPVRALNSAQQDESANHGLNGHPGFDPRVGDAFDLRCVSRAMEGARAVVNLLDGSEPELYPGYLAGLASLAKWHGIARLIIVREGQIEDPEGTLFAAHARDLPVAVLRLAQLFGVSWRKRPDLPVHRMVARAWRGETIRIANASERRSLIHVRDAADGIIAALHADEAKIAGQIFALGDARLNYSGLQIARAVQMQFPAAKIEETAAETAGTGERVFNFDRARRRLRFVCSLPLEGGIRELRVAEDRKHRREQAPAFTSVAMAGQFTI